MESKFKKGDRVRYIGEGEFEEFLFSFNRGDEFIITEAYENKVIIDLECYQTFHNEDLELVSRPSEDKKTAFLTELKELLTKYDADITMGFRVKDRVVGVIFEVDNQQLYYPAKIEEEDLDPSIIYQRLKTNYPITPSNIFDYDK